MSGASGKTQNTAADHRKTRRVWRDGVLARRYASAYARISRAELSYVSRLILLVSVSLTFFGCIMVLSASSVRMISQGMSPFNQGERQLQYAVGGLALMLVVGFLPVGWYRRRWVLNTAVVLGILLQVAVLVVGVEVGGNRNWIVLGPVQLQPSELSKPILIMWMALMLARQGDVSKNSWRALLPALFGFLPLVGTIMLGRDLGTAIVYGVIFMGMLWLAGTRNRTMWVLVGFALVLAIFAVVMSENRIQRVFGAAGVCDGATCDQSNAGKVALATGGLWGVGLGQSRQKYNYLPEAHNDYIFAIIGEELGLVGTLAVVLLYLGLIYCSVTIMVRTSDRFVRLAAGGITVWITAQALINMGMVTGVLPVIGVPLPFISYGGSSLLASMFAAGLLFAFSRQAPVYPLRRDPNRNLSPREIRRENEDWQRRLVLGQAVAEENRRMVQAGGALGLDVWHWRSQLRDAIHGLLVWLGLSSEQRARAHQRRVQQRELAAREAQKQQAAERERELLERQRLQQAQKQQAQRAERTATRRPSAATSGQQRPAAQARPAKQSQAADRSRGERQRPESKRPAATVSGGGAARPRTASEQRPGAARTKTQGTAKQGAPRRQDARRTAVRGSQAQGSNRTQGKTQPQAARTRRPQRTGSLPEGLRPLHGGAPKNAASKPRHGSGETPRGSGSAAAGQRRTVRQGSSPQKRGGSPGGSKNTGQSAQGNRSNPRR